jgi:hypothetical protein
MFTSEELESFDIFPKEYSCSCLFKFLLYSISIIIGFVILYAFYTDSDMLSLLTMNYRSNYDDIIINDYLTNKLIELSPKNFLSQNKSNFIKNYEDLGNNFIKEYVMNSYPCLIRNATKNFLVKDIINLVENKLINDNNEKLIFEYRPNPYTQFFDDDYRYLKTTYSNFLNLTKNFSNNYYFLNEYNIVDAIGNLSKTIFEKHSNNNHLIKDMDLSEIDLSYTENYVVIWGHANTDDHFICLEKGSLEFILIPPQEKKYLYPFNKKGPINYSRINFFDGKNELNENYHDFLKVKKLYINLLSGECLYIPAFWWRSYRTNKETIEKTRYLTYKYNSNSHYLNRFVFVKNNF